MKRYRIGRVQEPWTNLEPPIRSPSYREHVENKGTVAPRTGHRTRRSVDIASLGFLKPKLCTSTTQQSESGGDKANTRRSHGISSALVNLDAEKQPLTETTVDSSAEKEWRARHAAQLEQEEIDQNKLDWPALDQQTQRSIMLEYRALHEEIKAKGLYKCRYSEYAIESIRYAVLFCSFLYLLKIEWYYTSAVLLGCFWVRIFTLAVK